MPPKASGSGGPRTAKDLSGGLSVPAFLKLLTSSPKSPLTMSQAIAASSKLLPKGVNNLTKLQGLTQVDMAKIGIEDEDIRKGIMILTGREKGKGGSPGKRKRGSDLDRPLPTRAVEEIVQVDLDFEEILAEEGLKIKSIVINRAPVMTAWATVVAERLGFQRQEALSIAHVFTDMNASSRGVALGILPEGVLKVTAGPSQPFVDLMGRKVPVLSMQGGEWRAISKGAVAEPSKAFLYLQRSFRQQLGVMIGALRLLAESFEPNELNQKGYGLYLDFRPESDGWGKKAEVFLSTILDLRRFLTHDELVEEAEVKEEGRDEVALGARLVKSEGYEVSGVEEAPTESKEEEPQAKRVKVEDVEGEVVDHKGEEEDEFDALLNDDLDLSGFVD